MRTVLCGEGPYEPQAALAEYLRRWPPTATDPVHLVFATRRTTPPIEVQPHLQVSTFLPGRGLRDLGDVNYLRWRYSQICAALVTGQLRPDVVIACATPPDTAGHRSLGAVDGFMQLALDRAGELVLEEIPWLPRVPGAAVIRRTDCVVVQTGQRETDEVIRLSRDFDEVDTGIARHILACLPARPTVALGMGRIPDALADFLCEVDGLRITSGVITESARALGAVVAEPMRAMSVIGPPPLLDWAAKSGMVRLLPSTFVHAPDWLSQHRRFVAVLSTLQVDASGAANSEQLGTRLVSGVGGSADLAAGAHASPGGLTVLALRAQDRQGRSTLVAELGRPTIPAVLVDVIATEHGAVRVTGLTADARRRAVASIF